MKAFTDLKQSKKLTEILPVESADMYYKYVLPKSDKIIHTPVIGNPIDSLKWYNKGYTFRGRREPITLSEYCIPCWSLAALINVISKHSSRLEIILRVDKKYNIFANFDKFIVFRKFVDIDNAIDVCVDMIETLYKQKLL